MDSYMNYQAMLTAVGTNLAILKKACDRMEMPENSRAIEEVQERINHHTFRVGIMGEFRRGKSTVINALLGKEVCPSDIIPTSATVNRIVWDSQPHAVINFKKETGMPPKNVAIDQLSAYVTKLTKEYEKTAEDVEDAVVYYPCNFCQNGVEIVDTPGLNDDERMNYVSENVIPSLDAIIMVLVPESPFSLSEAAFVRTKVMTSDMGRLIFLLNKIDNVRPKDRERLIDSIRDKIRETVLEKTVSMYGEGSEEYEETKKKLAGIKIFPISARTALDARLEGDDEELGKSGMKAFETELSRLLTEERGMLELVSPVSVIMSKTKDLLGAVEMRTNSLLMEKEEFEKIQKDAMEKLEVQRREKKAKVKEIKGVAASTYQDLMPMVAAAYNHLEHDLRDYIDTYPISAESMKNESEVEAFSQTLGAQINDHITMVIQENTEKMQVEIAKRMSREIEGLEVYSRELSMEMEGIKCSIVPRAGATYDNKSLDYAAIGIEVVTNFTSIVPGLGAAITGFRDHGVLGGVVGMGVGYAATHVGFAASFALLSAAVGATVALPVALVAGGLIGAVGGKKVVNWIFGPAKRARDSDKASAKQSEAQLQTLRNSIIESVMGNISEMRREQVIENWLKDTTDKTFGGLSEKLDQETEQVLKSMESTLTQIQVDLASGEVQRTESMKRLKDTQEELINVLNNIKPIKDKLDAAMSHPVEA